MVLNGTRGRQGDKARKTLHNISQDLNLKIAAEVNNQTVNLLDVVVTTFCLGRTNVLL